MGAGMKKGRKMLGIGLGILLELSTLQVYAAVTEDSPPVSSAEETETMEKLSPTAESIMRNFIASEAEEMETGKSRNVDELADGVSAVLMDGDELDINEVNFPDEQFRSLVSGYDGYEANQGWDWTKRDGKLSASEIARVQSIYISRENQTISVPPVYYDLTGIEHFTALEYLDCFYNQLTSLDVSQNTALIKFNCGVNQLMSLDVSQNTVLEYLWCNANQLMSLDVSRNTVLTTLGCSGNRLTSLDVSQNTALGRLYCSDNQLTSLDVSQNTALTSLSCANNQLSCLDLSNTNLEADDAVIDISNQTIEINGTQINMLTYDSKFDAGRVSELNGLILKDGVFTLADGAESGSYVYDVRLPSGKSIPMDVTIKKVGNLEDEGGSGSGDGSDTSGEGDNSGNNTGGGSGEGNGSGEGSVSGNGIGGGSEEGSGSGGGSNEDSGSQEESRTETTEGNFPSAILEIVHRILGNRVQISGGSYIVSSIDGVYIAKSIIGIAVITPKKNVAEAVGLTAADINNGENISLYVCDSSDKEKKKALKNIADGMGKKVMAYVNVDMYSINKRGRVKTIRTASRPITIAFGVPAAFVNPARSYSVICMDENGKTVIFPDTDRDNKTITIEADVFGAYMIVY